MIELLFLIGLVGITMDLAMFWRKTTRTTAIIAIIGGSITYVAFIVLGILRAAGLM